MDLIVQYHHSSHIVNRDRPNQGVLKILSVARQGVNVSGEMTRKGAVQERVDIHRSRAESQDMKGKPPY